MCCGGRSGKKSRSRGKARFKRGVTARQMMALSYSNKLVDFLLCRPEHYGINYSINPWMNIHNSADTDKAVEQWNSLKSKIEELNGSVQLVKSISGLPDMVFTANAALILKNGTVLLSKFTHPERSGEEDLFEAWFVENGHTVIRTDKSFEGAGDALYLGDTLVGGYGFRSDPEVYLDLTSTVVRLVDPYFYHLDTCFCPLQDMDYMIWAGAFDNSSLSMIRNLGGSEISIPENEARLFACNAVRIGKNVILPAGCPETESLLAQKGYLTHPLEMSEFIKSGGACKCLTLVI
jgi:N-dimethylarginine dimethylaminohydrolase